MTKSMVPVSTDRTIARRETNPFSFLQQEIDRLFDGFGRNFPAFATTGTTLPSMDVSETDKAIEIVAELPGLEKKDVELNLTENLLTIRGEKKNEREEKNRIITSSNAVLDPFPAPSSFRRASRRKMSPPRLPTAS
jgi:HSP20 family protein